MRTRYRASNSSPSSPPSSRPLSLYFVRVERFHESHDALAHCLFCVRCDVRARRENPRGDDWHTLAHEWHYFHQPHSWVRRRVHAGSYYPRGC